MSEPLEDEFTEIVDAVVTRVDMVGKGANGLPFLIAKDQMGVIDPSVVRELIKDAEPVLITPERDDITMTASPAALMKMIHEAAQRPMKEPEVAQRIAKDDDMAADVAVGDLMGDGGTLSDSVPGSADWENMDGDTAMNALAVLGRIQAVISWLADREAAEAVTNDPDDAGNVWNLEDAGCAVQCAIDTLAAFAAGEKLEASLEDEMEAVGKAVAPLTVLEGMAPLVKAGRVLSAANETAIRGAVESLTNVLNTLPAPIPDAAPVAKEQEPTVAELDDALALAKGDAEVGGVTADLSTEPRAEQDRSSTDEPADASMEKAKGDPLTPMYDDNGKLIGMVDSANIIPIATPGGDAVQPEDAAPDATEAPADTAPAAAGDVGTPAAAAPAAPVAPEDVTKEALDPLQALEARVAASFEKELAERDARYELLKGEFDKYLQTPRKPGVLQNSAYLTHTPGGQSDADQQTLWKAMAQSADPQVRNLAIDQRNAAATAAFQGLLSAGGQPAMAPLPPAPPVQ